MATKSTILTTIKTTAEFLGNSDRPEVCTLRVDSLSTLSRNTKGVQYKRKALRAFAKAILTERQSYNDGIYILRDVNVKALKDSQLGELLSATNPNGVSKYYTTIRRMVYQNILADALASEETEAEPQHTETEAKPQTKKPRASKKAKAKKPRASKAKKPKASKKAEKVLDAILDENGNLKTTLPESEPVKGSLKGAKTDTTTLSATFGNKTVTVSIPVKDWENTSRKHWVDQCRAEGLGFDTSWNKREIAVHFINCSTMYY
jgi:hypothetical protein